MLIQSHIDMMQIEFDKPFDLIPGVIEPACLPIKRVENGILTSCLDF